MYEQFGIKELYEVAFKTTNNMRIFNQDFEKNEVLMYFDKIQISNFNTVSDHRYAEGGKNNFSLLGWDNVQSAEFQFENGLYPFTNQQNFAHFVFSLTISPYRHIIPHPAPRCAKSPDFELQCSSEPSKKPSFHHISVNFVIEYIQFPPRFRANEFRQLSSLKKAIQ